MKHGSKGPAKAARAQETAAAATPVFAVPFPLGASPIVAEEALPAQPFTPREQEIGGWLADGKNDPEIARIFNLSVETIRTYIKSMREKVGVESRNALFAWIWRNRWFVQLHRPTPAKRVKY